jgi:hypothetical protein
MSRWAENRRAGKVGALLLSNLQDSTASLFSFDSAEICPQWYPGGSFCQLRRSDPPCLSVMPTGPKAPHAYWRVCANNHCRVAGCKLRRRESLVRLGGSLSPAHLRKRNKQNCFPTAVGSNACELLDADSKLPRRQTIPTCGVSTGQRDPSQAKLLSIVGEATVPPSADGSGAARPAFHTRS